MASDGGIQLPHGSLLQAGTVIGMNAWVVNRSKSVYGHDAEYFRPERWLREENETVEAFSARQKVTKDTSLTFGAGDRVCLGKWLAVTAIHKIIAT